MPSLIKKDELLWSPANTSAWSVSNQVLTIHDASVFDHPEWFRPAFAAWTRLSWKMLARKSKAIVTVSDFSKQRLQHHLNIPNKKIRVVYNGVGKPFEPQSTNNIEKVKEKYGIKRPYFLFVGTMEPRKNLRALIQAWEMANLNGYELFIAGAESVGRVFNAAGHTSTHGHVGSRYASLTTRLLDRQSVTCFPVTYVPDEDLPVLYSGAMAFVYPSLYEGFGLPISEAMACGTPVIASDIATFREIYGDAAMLVNPREPQEIADAMKTMIEDKSNIEKLHQRGLEKAARLSWDESARRTQKIIESIQ